MGIPEFIRSCDQFCQRHGVTRVWLSKRLLKDTYWLDNIATGKAGIGVRRIDRAARDLIELDVERRIAKPPQPTEGQGEGKAA